jgi:Arc/MetJ-type ribon-helix-helix transcriptional regulator
MISYSDIYLSYIREARMARMTRTIISIPEDEKKWIDGFGKRHRVSSAEVVRLAVREFRRKKARKGLEGELQETAGIWKSVSAEWERTSGGNAEVNTVKGGRSPYGSPLPADITDPEELRRRATAAAGRFESGVSDLSIDHDKYLTVSDSETGHETKGPPQTKKLGGGAR